MGDKKKRIIRKNYKVISPLQYKGKLYKVDDKIMLTSEQKNDLIKYIK